MKIPESDSVSNFIKGTLNVRIGHMQLSAFQFKKPHVFASKKH